MGALTLGAAIDEDMADLIRQAENVAIESWNEEHPEGPWVPLIGRDGEPITPENHRVHVTRDSRCVVCGKDFRWKIGPAR